MQNVVIKKEKFELAINNLEKLKVKDSKLEASEKIQLKDSLFAFFNHRITGEELQKVVNNVENNLNLVSSRVTASFEQISEVYNALVALDKEYISGIVGATTQAIEATKKAEDAQSEITRTINALEIMVHKLNDVSDAVNIQLTKMCGEEWQNAAEHDLSVIKEIDGKICGFLAKTYEIQQDFSNLKLQLSYQDNKINDLDDKITRLNEKNEALESKSSSLEEKENQLSNELSQAKEHADYQNKVLHKNIEDTNNALKEASDKFNDAISNLSSEMNAKQEETNLKINKLSKYLLALTITSSALFIALITLVILLITKVL